MNGLVPAGPSLKYILKQIGTSGANRPGKLDGHIAVAPFGLIKAQ